MLVKVVDQQPTCFKVPIDWKMIGCCWNMDPGAGEIFHTFSRGSMSASSGTQGFLFYFGGCGTCTWGIFEVWLHCPYVLYVGWKKVKADCHAFIQPKARKKRDRERWK